MEDINKRIRNFSDEYFPKEQEQQQDEININSQQLKNKESKRFYSEILEDVSDLVLSTALDVVGYNDTISTPFGDRLLTYCDFTASGRALTSIEQYLMHEVLPMYANTHTLSDATGLQTTLFRREARDIVKRGCRGSNVEDVLLFIGSGTTSAINSLIQILGIPHLSSTGQTPLVLLGPYEHHSNILPWRESGCEVITIPEQQLFNNNSNNNNKIGGIDIELLEVILKRYRNEDNSNSRLIIGSFSAASNVSGTLEDTLKVTEILKRYGALCFWDYAAAAPYVPIDMNPHNDSRYKKDALFFSPHKFLGGVSTPGVLCIKKNLLKNTVPHRPGGGSVLYVTNNQTTYLSNFEEKEEAGTPDIIGSIRSGLVFQHREQIGIDRIYRSELEHSDYLRRKLSEIKNLVLLGNLYENKDNQQQQLPIISFLIRYAPDPTLMLHHNFIAALLNDLFGIQTRASCACAGPYLESLLGLNQKDNDEFLESIFEKQEIIRPGMVRLNVSYVHSRQEVDFIISALEFICQNGWKFMPLYTLVVSSGEFKHRSKLNKMPERRWLSSISYGSNGGKMAYSSKRKTIDLSGLDSDDCKVMDRLIQVRLGYLDDAHRLLNQLLENQPKILPDQSSMLTEEANRLRWFALPTDVSQVIRSMTPDNHDLIDDHFDFSTSNTVISNLLNREIIIKPHKNYIAGTNGLNQNQLFDILQSIYSNSQDSNQLIKDQFTYPIKSISLNLIYNNNNNNNNNNSKEIIEDTTLNIVCPLKPKVDNSNLVESNICINCYHDHTAITTNNKSTTSSKECRSCECVNFVPRMEGSKKEKINLQKKVHSNINQSINDYGMIKEGDRILVGVSGGKDSLTLINALLDIRRRSKVKFHVAACTVDPQSPEYDPSPLKKYFQSLGVEYFYVSQNVMESAKICMKEGSSRASICSFCSRMRRGILYNVCRQHKFTTLALGQHLDDLSESFIMSAFYNGILGTMKVNYMNEQGDIRIIRPLCNIRESQTRYYAKIMALPVISENCPACFAAPKERQRIKLLLASQENINPMIHHILFKAMQPLITIDKTTRISGRSMPNYNDGLSIEKQQNSTNDNNNNFNDME